MFYLICKYYWTQIRKLSADKTALEREQRNQLATINDQKLQISRLTSSSSSFEAKVQDITKQLAAANAEKDRILRESENLEALLREEARVISERSSEQISSLQSSNADFRRRLAGCPFHSVSFCKFQSFDVNCFSN